MRPYSILIFLLVMLTSCATTPKVVPTSTLIEPVNIFKPTTTSEPISKPTLTPTLPPTLNADETNKLIVEFLQDNGKCQLPCFWGLTPEKTDLKSLQSLIGRLGNITEKEVYVKSHVLDNMRGATSINLFNNNSRASLEFSYILSNGQLAKLFLHAASYQETGNGADIKSKITFGDSFFNQRLGYYLLPQILSNYGKPSKIIIMPILYGAPYLVKDLFSIVLIYSKKGFFVEYIFPNNTEGNYFVGCPLTVGYINIAAWSSEREIPLTDIVSSMSGIGINELTTDKFKSLENATSMTESDFYTFFKNPQSTNCLKTPVNMWTP